MRPSKSQIGEWMLLNMVRIFWISTLILRWECPLKIASLISSNTSNRSLVCKKVKMLINDWASYDIIHYLPCFVICSYHSKNWGNNNIHHRRIGWKRERRILQVSVHPIKHRIRKVPAVSCDTFQHSKSPLPPPQKNTTLYILVHLNLPVNWVCTID